MHGKIVKAIRHHCCHRIYSHSIHPEIVWVKSRTLKIGVLVIWIDGVVRVGSGDARHHVGHWYHIVLAIFLREPCDGGNRPWSLRWASCPFNRDRFSIVKEFADDSSTNWASLFALSNCKGYLGPAEDAIIAKTMRAALNSGLGYGYSTSMGISMQMGHIASLLHCSDFFMCIIIQTNLPFGNLTPPGSSVCLIALFIRSS